MNLIFNLYKKMLYDPNGKILNRQWELGNGDGTFCKWYRLGRGEAKNVTIKLQNSSIIIKGMFI